MHTWREEGKRCTTPWWQSAAFAITRFCFMGIMSLISKRIKDVLRCLSESYRKLYQADWFHEFHISWSHPSAYQYILAKQENIHRNIHQHCIHGINSIYILVDIREMGEGGIEGSERVEKERERTTENILKLGPYNQKVWSVSHRQMIYGLWIRRFEIHMHTRLTVVSFNMI